jgi:uncharacterized protein
MNADVSSILLGVRDMERSKEFYTEGLGWKVKNDYGVSLFFQPNGGSLVGFYGRDGLAADNGASPEGSGFSGLVLTYVVRSEERVDEILAEAERPEARSSSPPPPCSGAGTARLRGPGRLHLEHRLQRPGEGSALRGVAAEGGRRRGTFEGWMEPIGTIQEPLSGPNQLGARAEPWRKEGPVHAALDETRWVFRTGGVATVVDLRRHQPGYPGPPRHFRAVAGRRRRGRPGADRPNVRDPRRRLPRPRGRGDPHPGVALSRPAIAPEVKRPGLMWHKEVPRNG